MADKKERLALSVIDFLTESLQDGTIKGEDKEGIEIAGSLERSVISKSIQLYRLVLSSPVYCRGIWCRSK